jgi:hypothetical protein
MEIPFKVYCINDSHRPNEIPTSKWVKVGNLYTVTNVARLNIQDGKLGFKLAEVSLQGCYPYEFYAANRFAIIADSRTLTEIELSILLREAIEEENQVKL